MKKIKHPHGNIRSFFLKFIKNLIQETIRLIVNCVCKLDSNDEIIISSATHAPWKKDKKFYDFYNNVKNFTLLDNLLKLSSFAPCFLSALIFLPMAIIEPKIPIYQITGLS